MRLYALHCGGDLMDWAAFDPFDERVGTKVYDPYFMYVVTHPQGNVLLDSGAHPELGTDPEARLGPGRVVRVTARACEDTGGWCE
jgi:N-acyl homoserine lactone hydrolase